MDELIAAMKVHDWYYDYSDDGRVYRAGRASEDNLEKLFQTCGRPVAVWNEHCPKEFRKF